MKIRNLADLDLSVEASLRDTDKSSMEIAEDVMEDLDQEAKEVIKEDLKLAEVYDSDMELKTAICHYIDRIGAVDKQRSYLTRQYLNAEI